MASPSARAAREPGESERPRRAPRPVGRGTPPAPPFASRRAGRLSIAASRSVLPSDTDTRTCARQVTAPPPWLKAAASDRMRRPVRGPLHQACIEMCRLAVSRHDQNPITSVRTCELKEVRAASPDAARLSRGVDHAAVTSFGSTLSPPCDAQPAYACSFPLTSFPGQFLDFPSSCRIPRALCFPTLSHGCGRSAVSEALASAAPSAACDSLGAATEAPADGIASAG